MYSYDRTAASYSLVPKFIAFATKALKTSIKIVQGAGLTDDGVKNVERVLDSLSSMYGGGFLSGKETPQDAKIQEIQALLREIRESSSQIRSKHSAVIIACRELIDLFKAEEKETP